jgi:hypothetical protein
MAYTGPLSNVGAYYSKYPHEEALGPIFIRKTLDIHHVCKQSDHDPNLYEIVADCGANRELAEVIVNHLMVKHNFK